MKIAFLIAIIISISSEIRLQDGVQMVRCEVESLDCSQYETWVPVGDSWQTQDTVVLEQRWFPDNKMYSVEYPMDAIQLPVLRRKLNQININH